MEQNSLDKSFPCANYAVAFFDVLGQRKKLLDLPRYPKDESELKAMPELLNRVAQPVFNLRKDLATFYDELASLSLVSNPPKNIKPSAIEAAKDFESPKLKFQPMSDSFVAWVPLSTLKENFSLFGLHRLLQSAIPAMLKSLADGNAIRGAIEIGYGLEDKDHILYGPALARAYVLESRCTNWPRVIVGEGVIELWDMIQHLNEKDMIYKPNARFAMFDKTLTFIDSDGLTAIDYLGSTARSMFKTIIEGYQEVALRQVKRFQQKYRNDRKIRSKYDHVLHYFNSRLNLISDR